jgi:hypothetical protein
MFEGFDINKFLVLLLEGLLGAVGSYAALHILPKLPEMTKNFVEWGKAHAMTTKSTYANQVLGRLIDLAGAKVLALENTLIENLKEAAKDGRITKEELKQALSEVKARAVNDVKAHASAQGVLGAAKDVFLGDETKLDSWLNDIVEATVAKLPPSGLQTAKAPGATPAIAGPVAAVVEVATKGKKNLIKNAPAVP